MINASEALIIDVMRLANKSTFVCSAMTPMICALAGALIIGVSRANKRAFVCQTQSWTNNTVMVM